MKNLILLFILLIAWQLKAQNQLTFSSVFNKNISFTHPPMGGLQYFQYTDSIVVPQGYVLKIESISELFRQVYYPINTYTGGIYVPAGSGRILSTLLNGFKIGDGVAWFGTGTHPLVISTANSVGFDAAIHINGLLFKVDP
jgi:hypothetical protein